MQLHAVYMVCFGQSNALIIHLSSIHTMVTHTVNSHKGLKGEICHLNVNKRFTTTIRILGYMLHYI